MYNPQLETLISVAENGSFSKAAEKLYITPTAVMKQINALEERLGVAIFERTNHGLRLTDAGISLFQDAKYIIDYSAKAVEKAKDINAKSNSIRVGASIMTPAKFLLDIWSEIQRYAADLKIELIPFDNTPENAREILKNLGKHIDVVAGIYDERLLSERNCQVEYLYNKQIFLAVPVSHPLSRKSEISTKDLKDSGVMLIKKGWNRFVDELRKDLNANDVNIVDFEFFSINAFNRAVKDNISIMTIDGWENIHPLLKIVPVAWQYKIPFGIMYSKEPSKQVKDFINVVRKVNGLNF